MQRYLSHLLCAASVVLGSCESDSDPTVDCNVLILSLDVLSAVSPSSCLSLDGSIQMSTVGFSPPLEFSLNNGSPNRDGFFDNLGAGEFNIEVTDVNGCTSSSIVSLRSAESSFSILSILSTAAGCGFNDGTIEITTSIESGLSYSLDGIIFQEDDIFNNVEAGVYNVVVTDSECRESQEHQVLSGVSFESDIKAIISANCAVNGCHVSGTNRVDFSQFSNIQQQAGNIRSRTQSGSMPPGSRSISQEQMDLIACWVDDGALDN
ncbi:MAG: hypothetical protein AAGF85_06820 [Bacteroidota bacterium]